MCEYKDEKRVGLRSTGVSARPVNAFSRVRGSLLLLFFVKGAATASWASRIPAIQSSLGLSNQHLGFALVGLAVGLILSLLSAGGVVQRWGSRKIATICGAATACLLPVIGVSPNAASLFAALLVWGALHGTMDVAINSQAVAEERRRGRPLMSSFHAAFSCGYFDGAGIGSLMIARLVGPFAHCGIVAPAFLLVSSLSARLLGEDDAAAAHDDKRPVFQVPHRSVLPFGIAAFAAVFVESVVNDWSGLYLRDIVEAPAAFHPLGVVAFAVSMVVSRLVGDRMTSLLSARTVVRVGGVMTALGLTIAILAPSIASCVVGFSAAGFGVGTIVPLAFSSASFRAKQSSSSAIAGVATIAYSGFLFAPPIVGTVSEALSLRVSFALVAVVAIGLVGLASRFQATKRSEASASLLDSTGATCCALPDTAS